METLKLRIFSDLHLEFHSQPYKVIDNLAKGGDVLILAGDISHRLHLEEHLSVLADGYEKVFYLPGNHEFYGGEVSNVTAIIDGLEGKIPNLTVLRPGWIHEYKNQRFLGCPLWFRETPESRASSLKRCINDFSQISGFDPWVFEQNRSHIEFLRNHVGKGDVVITHYLPSHDSVPRVYLDSPINCYFVCDMEELIKNREPQLWVHGHTHGKVDYKIGTTRVFANPMGYPNENGPFPQASEPSLIEITPHEQGVAGCARG